MSRNKEHRGAAVGGAPIGSVFFVSAHLFVYVMNIYGYSLYIPYIFHIYIYIYVLNIFHIVSFVCFVIYSVNSSSGHDRSQTFGPISQVLNPKPTFWGNFIMVLHGFASRSPKNIVFPSPKQKINQQPKKTNFLNGRVVTPL